MSRGASLLGAMLLTTSCATYERGLLAMASRAPIPVPAETIAEQVEGRSCRDVLVQRLENAVEDALGKAPGANALVDASFSFERLCLVVRARAVRVP